MFIEHYSKESTGLKWIAYIEFLLYIATGKHIKILHIHYLKCLTRMTSL